MKFLISCVFYETANDFRPKAKQLVLLFDPHQRKLNHVIVIITFESAAANYLCAHHNHDALIALVHHIVINLEQAHLRQDVKHRLCQFYKTTINTCLLGVYFDKLVSKQRVRSPFTQQ